MHRLFLILPILFVSCGKQEAPLTPEQKFKGYFDEFLNEWREANPFFDINASSLNPIVSNTELNEHNGSELNSSVSQLVANFSMPVHWTEFQFVEDSEFAQGYDVMIQIQSTLEVKHRFSDGNWTFDSARQFDFNATIIDFADDYSEMIGKAWIKRLPEEKNFPETSKLFKGIPPKRDY